jgi:hypothetical protein
MVIGEMERRWFGLAGVALLAVAVFSGNFPKINGCGWGGSGDCGDFSLAGFFRGALALPRYVLTGRYISYLVNSH